MLPIFVTLPQCVDSPLEDKVNISSVSGQKLLPSLDEFYFQRRSSNLRETSVTLLPRELYIPRQDRFRFGLCINQFQLPILEFDSLEESFCRIVYFCRNGFLSGSYGKFRNT
jgi:hypothetical protein